MLLTFNALQLFGTGLFAVYVLDSVGTTFCRELKYSDKAVAD